MFTRVQKATAPQTDSQKPRNVTSNVEIKSVIDAVSSDPLINRRANFYSFKEKYDQKKGKGSLDKLVDESAHTANGDLIKERFVQGVTTSFASQLAETLPLYANTPGRLGECIQAVVTKTAKQDDQGGSFVDLVIEIKNDWIANGAPRELQNVPAKMVFLVDVSTNLDEEASTHKRDSLRNAFLLYGEKAKVLCYEDSFGELGIERPKILVTKSPDYLEQVGGSLGSSITQLASDKFSINSPHKFNEEYRAYFLDLMTAIGENAKANAEYIGRLSDDNEKRKKLKAEYEKIVAFIEVYKKTPVTRPRV